MKIVKIGGVNRTPVLSLTEVTMPLFRGLLHSIVWRDGIVDFFSRRLKVNNGQFHSGGTTVFPNDNHDYQWEKPGFFFSLFTGRNMPEKSAPAAGFGRT